MKANFYSNVKVCLPSNEFILFLNSKEFIFKLFFQRIYLFLNFLLLVCKAYEITKQYLLVSNFEENGKKAFTNSVESYLAKKNRSTKIDVH